MPGDYSPRGALEESMFSCGVVVQIALDERRVTERNTKNLQFLLD